MTYDPRDFTLGDVAMVRRGPAWTGRALFTLTGWVDQGGDPDHKSPLFDVNDARPLVVLDPESDEDVAMLARAIRAHSRYMRHQDVTAVLRSLVAKPMCSASLTIAGKPYACAERPEHGGPHRNPDAEAVWS